MFGTVAGELAHFARVGAKAAFNFARTPLVSVFSSKGASMPATRAAMGAVVLLFPAVKLFRGQGLYHMWHMGTGRSTWPASMQTVWDILLSFTGCLQHVRHSQTKQSQKQALRKHGVHTYSTCTTLAQPGSESQIKSCIMHERATGPLSPPQPVRFPLARSARRDPSCV